MHAFSTSFFVIVSKVTLEKAHLPETFETALSTEVLPLSDSAVLGFALLDNRSK
jgi:hypothetical protein